MTDDLETIRLTIHPEPGDEELMAILQALRVFEAVQPGCEALDCAERSPWRAEGRLYEQRLRHWPLQERSWARRS